MSALSRLVLVAVAVAAGCGSGVPGEKPAADHPHPAEAPAPAAPADHGEHAAPAAPADHGDHAAHPAPAPSPEGAEAPPANPVQAEMRLLTAALEGAVRGIGTGDVRGVAHDLHRVHAAKEATGQALASGSYRPPKNPDQVEAFVAMDQAFHQELEGLVAASTANDVNAAAEALGAVMKQCQGCHTQFRR